MYCCAQLKVPIANTPEWFALEFRPRTCQIKAARHSAF
jgi:hypothetical protein